MCAGAERVVRLWCDRKSTAAEEGRDPDLIPAGPKTGPGKKRQQTKRAAGAPAAQRMRIQVRRLRVVL